jgi:monoterpene epsilon-lactone hydrolase
MADPEIEVIRDILRSQPRPTDLADRRRRLDALGTRYAVASDVRIEPVDANGVPAEWTTAPGVDTSRVILFLHGGGYISGSIDSHRHMVAETGRQAASRTLAVGYRLAPEHPYPAALEDALAAYRFLLSSGFAPGHIVLAGESAGGLSAVMGMIGAATLAGAWFCSRLAA